MESMANHSFANNSLLNVSTVSGYDGDLEDEGDSLCMDPEGIKLIFSFIYHLVLFIYLNQYYHLYERGNGILELFSSLDRQELTADWASPFTSMEGGVRRKIVCSFVIKSIQLRQSRQKPINSLYEYLWK